MRKWRIAASITLAGILAGCQAAEQPAPAADEAPIVLKAGQWTLDRTLTGYNTATVTAAEYAAHVGQKSTTSVCMSVDAKGLPDPDALAGPDGKDCTYKEPSVRKGRFMTIPIGTIRAGAPRGVGVRLRFGKTGGALRPLVAAVRSSNARLTGDGLVINVR